MMTALFALALQAASAPPVPQQPAPAPVVARPPARPAPPVETHLRWDSPVADSIVTAVRAAARSGERIGGPLRIVADTAWVSLYDPRELRDTVEPSATLVTVSALATSRMVRVERRKGQWTVVGR